MRKVLAKPWVCVRVSLVFHCLFFLINLTGFHITKTIFILQGRAAHDFCDIEVAFSVSFAMSMFATVFHLFLISGERYLAIKHTFIHATVVTKARVLMSSAVAWITVVIFLFVISRLTIIFFTCNAVIISSIVLLHILVYKEARQHEKQILSQQVSIEAREKFKQEKKALKLTTIILVTIFLCCLSPLIFLFVTWLLFSEAFLPHAKDLVRHVALLPPIINSFLNPVIYTVRKKEFRIAFTELILRKSLEDAEEFNRRMFGSRNNTARQQIGQEGQGHEQNAENENASQPAVLNDNHEENPEVQVSGA